MKRYVFSLKIKQLRNIRFLEFFCNLRTRSPYFYTFKLPAKVQTSLDYPQHNTVPRKGGNYFNSASFNPASSNQLEYPKIFNWPAILLRLVKSKKVPAGYAGRGSSRNSHENGIRTIIRRGEPSRFLR